MATPLGLCSSFTKGETNSLFLPSIRFASPPLPSSSSSQLALHSTRRSTSITAAAKPAATETTKREPRGIMKPRPVSPEMQAFLGGVPEIARTEALKKIWAYIKQRDLQDPENKKIIVCDENLKKIFDNKERIGFLEVAKLISPHFLK